MHNVSLKSTTLDKNMLITVQGDKEVVEERRLREKMTQEYEAEAKDKGQHINMGMCLL